MFVGMSELIFVQVIKRDKEFGKELGCHDPSKDFAIHCSLVFHFYSPDFLAFLLYLSGNLRTYF